MCKNNELQARLAVEHMSIKNCKECKFYCYSKEDQQCLFNSVSIDECNIVQLHLTGKLYEHNDKNHNDK